MFDIALGLLTLALFALAARVVFAHHPADSAGPEAHRRADALTVAIENTRAELDRPQPGNPES